VGVAQPGVQQPAEGGVVAVGVEVAGDHDRQLLVLGLLARSASDARQIGSRTDSGGSGWAASSRTSTPPTDTVARGS
jgi:hypothetical protein